MGLCRPLALFLGGGKLPEGAELPMLLVHYFLFFYSVAFEMASLVTPFLNKAVKGNSSTYAYIRATISVLQLIVGILFGRFGDLFSARNAMMVAHTASALNYGLMAAADSIEGVFLAILPTVLQHGF